MTTSEQTAGRLPAGWSYRLPTEAEWEFACRAGTTTTYYFGNTVERLYHFAWFSGNAGGSTHEVGSRAPNRWGLYDMHGNVLEWCSDWYGSLPGGNISDPTGPSSGNNWNGMNMRILRGGSFGDGIDICASAYRSEFIHYPYSPYNWNPELLYDPSSRNAACGFRVVLSQGQ